MANPFIAMQELKCEHVIPFYNSLELKQTFSKNPLFFHQSCNCLNCLLISRYSRLINCAMVIEL